MGKSYSELVKLKTFDERFDYLKLDGRVGDATFGSSRYLNQALYQSADWRRTKRRIILRDEGCDLAIPGHAVGRGIVIHHINPITEKQILDRDPAIFDPENLICVSRGTHQAIHYGDPNLVKIEHAERKPNDTCPWKKVS